MMKSAYALYFILLQLTTPLQLSVWMQRNIEYVPRTGTAWQSPAEMYISGKGVCRDFALLSGYWAELHGFDPEQYVFAYVTQERRIEAHVVTAWVDEGEKYCIMNNQFLLCGLTEQKIANEMMPNALRTCNGEFREWNSVDMFYAGC